MSPANKRSVKVGLSNCLIGILVGFFVSFNAIGHGWEWFPFYAGLAAFLTTSLLWRLCIERRNRFRIFYGILVGALSGFLSHYVCWYLQILILNIKYFIFGTGLSSLGNPPVNPYMGLSGALGLSFFSWLYLGWLTVLMGSIICGTYCWYWRN